MSPLMWLLSILTVYLTSSLALLSRKFTPCELCNLYGVLFHSWVRGFGPRKTWPRPWSPVTAAGLPPVFAAQLCVFLPFLTHICPFRSTKLPRDPPLFSSSCGIWSFLFSHYFPGVRGRKGHVMCPACHLSPTLILSLLYLCVRVVIADQPLCHRLSGCIPPLGSPAEGQHVEHQGILLPHECVWYQNLFLKTPSLARWPFLWEELPLFIPVMAKDPPLSSHAFVFFM